MVVNLKRPTPKQLYALARQLETHKSKRRTAHIAVLSVQLLLLLSPTASFANSPIALPGGSLCSTKDTKWLQLAECPDKLSEARSSTTLLPNGGRRIADYREPVPVAQTHYDHDAFCAALERPPAGIVLSPNDKEKLKSGAACDAGEAQTPRR